MIEQLSLSLHLQWIFSLFLFLNYEQCQIDSLVFYILAFIFATFTEDKFLKLCDGDNEKGG